ncbi:MAG: hypothetical protein ACI9VR_004223 [Cognaticolwellia sp.]|jgi:hypothetical protein
MITHVHATLADFLAACREKGVRGVALQEVKEIRPALVNQGVHVGVVRFSTVVAYSAGEVIRARIDQPPLDLVTQLNTLGVPIRRVNHNLG